MPFQFSPYHDQSVGRISELMQAPAAAQARAAQQVGQAQATAALQSGQAWGGAAQAIGGIPGQIQQFQAAAQRQQIGAQQLEQGGLQLREQKQALADRDAFKGILSSTPMIKENGMDVYDLPTITSKLASAQVDPSIYVKNLGELNQTFQQFNAARQAVVQQGAMKVAAAGNDPDFAKNFLDSIEGNGVYSKETIQGFRDMIDQGGQSAVAKLTSYLAGPEKKVPLAQGAKLVGETTGSTYATGEPKPPTEAELKLRAGQGDPVAIRALTFGTAPHTLEQQLLEAKAAGDKTKEKLLTDTIFENAQASKDQGQIAMARELAGLRADEARGRLEDRDPMSDKNQNKAEQEYRTVLHVPFSSRSGGVGLEDQKVNQAKHLLAAFDQNYDPKTKTWNIPKVQQAEIALGLARLMSPNGQVGIQLENEFNQRTAASDLSGLATYFTGKPFTGNTQDIFKMLHDSIVRQGLTAEQNRETYLTALKAQAPTNLSPDRRQRLEQSLNLNSIITKVVRDKDGKLVQQ